MRRWFPHMLESIFSEAAEISLALVSRWVLVDPERIIFPIIRFGNGAFVPMETVIGPDHLDGGLTRAEQSVFHGG
jgi:hypothetical protein